MAKQVGISPFQCGDEIHQFADIDVQRLVIRIESGGSTQVYITVDGSDPSASRADFFLDAGDAMLFKELEISKGSKIKILNITGDPLIFYYHKS